LEDKAEEWFKEVRDNQAAKELPPMNAADRRVIHKAADSWGLITESEGEGRDRHVVLKPAATKEEPVETKAKKKPAAKKPKKT